MESKFKLPTETVELPSKGLLYDKENPLSSGTVELKYMTAREEDILTNANFIQNGTVIDKLLKSLIVTPKVKYDEILSGDKNAIMVAARILSYGSEYNATVQGKQVTIDLSTIENKPIDEEVFKGGKNEFTFNLPKSENEITFKLLTHQDQAKIDREIAGLRKINNNETSSTTRLKHMITSINGSNDPKDIRDFVDNYMLAADARALREEYSKINPDIDTLVYPDGVEEGVELPITLNFFWPDARV